jgi:hypothetical protein
MNVPHPLALLVSFVALQALDVRSVSSAIGCCWASGCWR